jgi:hypothetical protein
MPIQLVEENDMQSIKTIGFTILLGFSLLCCGCDTVEQAEAQKGYLDGVNIGRRDAQSYKAEGLNLSSQFKVGTLAYRNAFKVGYNESYKRYCH